MAQPRPPPFGRQKSFIVENSALLDRESKKAILSLIMMEIGLRPGGGCAEARPVILENRVTGEVTIDLDGIESSEVILRLYNIVNGRRAVLNEPARSVSA